MRKQVLLYGLLGGVLIAGLKAIEYRWLLVEHSVETTPSRGNSAGSSTPKAIRSSCGSRPTVNELVQRDGIAHFS